MLDQVRLRRFFYVLLKDHLPYAAVQKAIDKAAAYERTQPGMDAPDEHPLMATARVLARRVEDPPIGDKGEV